MEYTFAELATIKYGKNQKLVESPDGTIPIYGTGGLMGYATQALYDKTSVLIGRKGTIDKVKFIDTPFWTVDTLFYTEINEEIVLPKFLFYKMSLINFMNYNEGTTIPSLRTETLNRLVFDIPPFPTQQKIAAILSSLDDKIELNNKINTNLEQQAGALFKNWFVDKYEKEGTIGDYCAVKSGFAFKSAWWQDEGTKVIRIGDIEQECLNLETCAHVATDKIEVAKDFIVQGGDLVIAMTGATIGKFSMIPKTQEPILVNQRVGKFFLGNNPIEKVPFIYCTLKQEEVITEFINRGQGSAQPNISTGDILSIPCWIPNKNEIDNFNKTIQPMFETIISNQEENRKLSGIRDSLLPKLMNGEIKV